MSSCWWQITVHCSCTCYVMNDTKKSCLQYVYIPRHDNLLLKRVLISSPLPFSVDFAVIYAQANP